MANNLSSIVGRLSMNWYGGSSSQSNIIGLYNLKNNKSYAEELRQRKTDDAWSKAIEKINSNYKMNVSDPKNELKPIEDKANKTLKYWRTSVQGVMLSARAASTAAIDYHETEASGDKVEQKKKSIRDGISLGTVVIGTFGGPWGAVAASAISLGMYLFGNKIANTIQSQGDTKRLNYKFDNWDYQKYGTYVYNNETNEWNARDAQKVKSRVLNNRTTA